MEASASSASIITLPKGGGAQHGMGEKFSPDLHTGTGNFTVPIALPPGRNGFQPQLNLVYSTGNGNGIFGLGWALSIPGVTRKTLKGIPKYRDYDQDLKERDIFILSGAEDLVPVSDSSFDPAKATRYRPRTEGLFARIIHHHDADANFWEVSSKDGLISIYGSNPAYQQTYHPDFQRQTTPATIIKPKLSEGDPDRIFAWKLILTKDPFGNRIEYLYEERDQSSAQDEKEGHQWNQPLLTQIRYVDYQENNQTKFLVTVSFKYETRNDSFSEYRAGFEIRASKRCKSILIETHTDQTIPVREYQLIYENDPYNAVSLLKQIEVIGFDDQGNRYDGQIHNGELRQLQLPPLKFGYAGFNPTGRTFQPITGADLPALSVGNPNMELVDLHGAGLPDILEMNGAVRYWRNLGHGHFDIPRPMREAPAGVELAAVGVQLIDADGDGRTDLMVSGEPLAGYFPLEFPAEWNPKSFQRYRYAPSFSLEDPEVRLIDLNGDGVTDALRSGTRMECFFNDPISGWAPDKTRQIERQRLEVFPNVNFSDSRVKFADMTGDGMQDIVLVYDGAVEYWPNLGHGNWGKRIHMKNSPRFPFGYDPKRILVGDVDGDGLADIVYVDHREVRLWVNQSGNGWTEQPVVIPGTPPVTDSDGLRLTDLKGSGISGVLWSADAGRLGPRNVMFLDFTGGVKPYLLDEMNNHLGAVTRIEYKTSTHFYLEDEKKTATRWRTPLPSPTQVVAKVQVIDEISRGRLTTEYRYHHGYWDGAEREFRGFGMVEQFDSESFSQYQRLPGAGQQFEAVSQVHFSPPTLTKTWFHLGPVGPEFGDWKEDLDWSNEFWAGDSPLLDHKEFVTPFLRALGADDPDGRRVRRDAIRSLRGSVIRTELYALDGSLDQDRPYTVTESQYGLREIDPPSANDVARQRIFLPHLLGQRTTQWERGDDPLTLFAFTDNYDGFGQPQQATSVACPRGWRGMTDRPTADYLATRTVTRYASPEPAGPYIHDRVAATATFEITDTSGQTVGALRSAPDTASSLRLNGQTLNYYDGVEFVGLAGHNFGRPGQYGALTRSEQLVFTDQHITESLANTGVPRPTWLDHQTPNWTVEYPASFRALVPASGGYVYEDGADGFHAAGYFTTTVCKAYDFQLGPGGLGLALTQRDPLSHETTIEYDSFKLMPVKVTDPVNLEMSAAYNYRVLQPATVTDPNGNKTMMEYSPIGLPVKTWVKARQAGEGDQLRPSVELTYDFLAFEQRAEPISVRTLRYERHDSDPDDAGETIETREYSDGFGRLLQTRVQADEVLFGDPTYGTNTISADIKISPGLIQGRRRNTGAPPNVIVSGWQIYDNKGRVVQKYEPFFDSGWDYATPGNGQFGKKATLFYDPRGQMIRTLNPDGSEQRVIFGIPRQIGDPPLSPGDTTRLISTPWEAYTYDANDNAGRTHAATAQNYRHHWDTPASIVIDALGRIVETVQRNRKAPGEEVEEYRTHTAYDIRGNVIEIKDTLARPAFHHVFDLANRRLRLDSIDAGLRLTFFDAAGTPVEARDGKGAVTLRAYDNANRPTHIWARDNSNETATLRERMEYGDELSDQTDARDKNLVGEIYRRLDEAGELIFARYDFKGNLLEKARRVINPDQLADQAFRVDWESGNTLQLNSSSYQINTTYDALNRITSLRYPTDVDNQRKILTPGYNRAGALESVKLDGAAYVERIAYNAKGQRTLIAYGNNVLTAYEYDEDTFRLARMWTGAFTSLGATGLTYQPTGAPLQNLIYSYELAGNVMTITELTPDCGSRNNPDAARYPALGVELSSGDALVREFEYDAIYRLIRATGREAVNIQGPTPWPDGFQPMGFNWGSPAVPTPGNAKDLTRRYVETYDYDPAGNMMKLWHDSNESQWTRYSGMSGFTPEEWSDKVKEFLAGTTQNWGNEGNRLTNFGTEQNGVSHQFDANGNMIQEFANRFFNWDHNDCLRAFREVDGAGNTQKEARYLYDSTGQRVMKRVLIGTQVGVTIYIDGVFEHRIIGADQNNTLHVMDNQSRIAMIRAGSALQGDIGPTVQYQLGDHLGSANIVIGGDDSSAGAFNNREEFFPYGETSFGSFAQKRYQYCGKERDEETGLYYYGARFYGLHLCRWISCDPAGAIDGFMLYRFCRNSPLIYRDSAGLQAEFSLQAESPGSDVDAASQAAAKTVKDQAAAHKAEIKEHGVSSRAGSRANRQKEFSDKEIERMSAGENVVNKRGARPTNCTEVVMDGPRSYFQTLGQTELWAEIEASARDSRGPARGETKNLESARLTFYIQQLNLRGNWKTAYIQIDKNAPENETAKKVEAAHAYPSSVVPVKGADSRNIYDDVRAPVDDSYSMVDIPVRKSNAASDRLANVVRKVAVDALIERMEKTTFAVGTVDAGEHGFIIVEGKAYEVHWKAGRADPNLYTAKPIRQFLNEHRSALIAFPPANK
jgi:RHS repeat-associated protein